MDHQRDAFGRLICDPDDLPLRDRVDVLRRLAGQLQASASREQRWMGRALLTWLQDGGDLAAVLGLRPPRGSKATAQRLINAETRARVLMRLSTVCGSDRAALRVLDGLAPCPGSAAPLVTELRRLGAPRSVAAFSRARASLDR